ncbi:hypothetical protein ACO1O0_007245 [Amphichorda felina]
MGTFTLPSTNGRVVTVLGGGVLGRRIACSWAASGYDVIIRDPSADQRAAALHYCATSASQYSDSTKRGTVEAVEDLPTAVKSAWLVIEAVPEKLSLKISTFLDLESFTAKDTILCSNSSSYKSREMVGELQAATRRRSLNMHYYMPPGNRIVELMTDGDTDPLIFPFLVEKLKEVGMSPYVARKESTGFIFNRLWAAIKREVLYILSEEVSTAKEIDEIWVQMFSNNTQGPASLMDAVGLDTVALIEKHYIAERGLSDAPIKFLQNFIDQGRLGNKSIKGGLFPPRPASNNTGSASESSPSSDDQEKIHPSPTLYILDIGLASPNLQDVFSGGRLLVGPADGKKDFKPLITNQKLPDGIDISLSAGKLFWTSMGMPTENDGAVLSSNLDGSDVKEIVPRGSGLAHTPKQLTIDHQNSKIYFADREGLRVSRCNFDGSECEVLVQRGQWQNKEHMSDCMRWCVGVTVLPSTGKFYWTQKGPSKGSKGRIFGANIDFLPGENAENRSDIEVLFQGLPEPIDIEVDEVENVLYWSDRGEIPLGNSVNSARLDSIKRIDGDATTSLPGKDYNIIARNFNETIGVKLDPKNRHLYVTDLGGAAYRVHIDSGKKERICEGKGALVGLALAYL